MLPAKIKNYKKKLIFYFKNRFAIVNEKPIFVLGNQKSGTSAIAHLLADFGGLSKTIDIPPLWTSNAIKIMRGQINFSDIASRHKFYFSKELIKEPTMSFFVDQVLATFPSARYLFIVRDPRDNIRSILNRMELPGHLTEIDNLHYEGLKQGYKVILNAKIWGISETENYIGVLAHRWNKAVDGYLRHHDRMILVKYEEFLANKHEFIVKLAHRLGIQQKMDITARLDIQYQPRGNHTISWEDFFGIRNLMSVEQICDSRMNEFGYHGRKTE